MKKKNGEREREMNRANKGSKGAMKSKVKKEIARETNRERGVM